MSQLVISIIALSLAALVIAAALPPIIQLWREVLRD